MSERTMTDKDVEALAEKLVDKVHALKHDFWIDPERHYQDHAQWHDFKHDDIRTMHDLLIAYRSARGLFWKAFFGLAIIGSLVLAAIGLGAK